MKDRKHVRNKLNELRSDVTMDTSRLIDDVARLSREVTILRMVCKAMWQIVRVRTDSTEAELSKCFSLLCTPDGTPVETKERRVVCAKCERTVKRGTVKCLYCGHLNEPDNVFDLLARW